jgi:hypothetical protein
MLVYCPKRKKRMKTLKKLNIMKSLVNDYFIWIMYFVLIIGIAVAVILVG